MQQPSVVVTVIMSSNQSNHQHAPHRAKNDNRTKKANKRKNRPPPSTEEKLSRALSWALRHQGPQIGLSMTPDGFVPVSQILTSKHPKLKIGCTLQDIEGVVRSNDKQRFHLDWRPIANYPNLDKISEEKMIDNTTNGDNTILCIRASQGHSLPFIDSDLLLTPLTKEELAQIPVIVHGTYQMPWETAICTKGLHRMARNHIHFAPGLPKDKDVVISGMRKTSDIYIYVDAVKCANNPDIVFYRSANGVLLTAGVKGSGTLPVEYFSHVTDSKGNVLLDQRETTKTDENEPIPNNESS